MPPPTMTTSARSGTGPDGPGAWGRRERRDGDPVVEGEDPPGRGRPASRTFTGCTGRTGSERSDLGGRGPEPEELLRDGVQAALPLARAGAEAGVALHRLEVAVPGGEGAPHLGEGHVLAGAEDRLTHGRPPRRGGPRPPPPRPRPGAATSPAASRPGTGGRPVGSDARREGLDARVPVHADAEGPEEVGRRGGGLTLRDHVAGEGGPVGEQERLHAGAAAGQGHGAADQGGVEPGGGEPGAEGGRLRTGAQDGDPATGEDAVLGERQGERAAGVDAGEVVALEGGRTGVPPGAGDDAGGADEPRAGGIVGDEEADRRAAVVPEAGGGGAERDLAAGGGDGVDDVGGPGGRGGLGLEAGAEPAAGEAVPLDEEDPPAGRGEDLGGGEASRTGAEHQRVEGLRRDRRARRRGPVGHPTEPGQPPGEGDQRPVHRQRTGEHVVHVEPAGRERVDDAEQVVGGVRPGVLALDRHPVPARRPAGAAVGLSVHAHQAGTAAPGEAEGSAGAVVLGAAGDDQAPGREQRRGHALAGAGRDRVAVEGDRAVGREAGVLEARHGRTRAEDSPGAAHRPRL